MKNLFFGLAFMLVGTLAFANSSINNISKIANDDNREADCEKTVIAAEYLAGHMFSQEDAAQLYFYCMGY